LITGASGDGKSSLVFAGLIPYARAGFLRAEFSNWVVVDFRPKRNPLHNLAVSLAHHFGNNDIEKIENNLKPGYSALIDLYKDSPLYSAGNQRSNLIILVDQFEEFFTNEENYNSNTATATLSAQGVVQLLLETVRIAKKENLPIYIICTMRSDYFGHCTAFRGLPNMIVQSQYYLERLTRDEILQAIEEPAILSGNKISKRLLQFLLNEISEDIGVDMLPILQHCLYQIWKAAGEGQSARGGSASGGEEMDLIHYAMVGGMSKDKLLKEDKAKFEEWYVKLPPNTKRAYKNPSLRNVLDIHANRLFDTAHEHYNTNNPEQKPITKEEAQHIIKVSFRCLTKMDENRAVRNLMSLQEITDMIGDKDFDCEKVRKVLDIFRIQGNTFLRPFITKEPATHNLQPETVLDITHEALMRNWTKLEEWAGKEHEMVIIYRDLTTQLIKWLTGDKAKEHLLSGGSLNYFGKWMNGFEGNPIAWLKRYMESENGIEITAQNVEEHFKDIQEYLRVSKENINRKKRLARVAVMVISVLLIITSFALYRSEQQKKKETELKRHIEIIAKSNEIATQAYRTIDKDPTLAFRLAEQAYKIYPAKLAKEVITTAYGNVPFYNVLEGHTGAVSVAKFSPDGNLILTASNDWTTRLWDLKGRLLKVLKGHRARVYGSEGANFSPDGKYIVTGANDSTIFVWNLDGKIIKIMKHDGKVKSVRFSPDGKHIVSASSDKTARLWDLKADEPIILKGHSGRVEKAIFSPDGKYIVTSSDKDNLPRIWDLNGSELHKLKGHKLSIRDIKISPDGKYIATASNDSTAILWDFEGRPLIKMKITGKVITAVFSPKNNNKRCVINLGFKGKST